MEEWRNLTQFPNHQVSSEGRVRNRKTHYILKPFPDRYGYLWLSLGSVDNVPVHRLVCEAFHGSHDDERWQVNHIDYDRQNNTVSNLEWCTPSENVKWSYDHGRINSFVALEKAREANCKPVRIIENGMVFPTVKECAKFLGVEPTNVSRCLVGVRKGQRLKGYHIEFINEEV